MIIKKGFTLIEIISAISIILIIFLYIFSTSNYVISFSKNVQEDVVLEQSAVNLENFIKNNLSKDSVSFDGIDKDKKEVYFSYFEEEGKYNYLLVKKTLSFKENMKQLRIYTKKDVYSQEKYEFLEHRYEKNRYNIVEDDVENMDIDFIDGKLYFDITLKKGDSQKNIEFYVKDLKPRKFI